MFGHINRAKNYSIKTESGDPFEYYKLFEDFHKKKLWTCFDISIIYN